MRVAVLLTASFLPISVGYSRCSCFPAFVMQDRGAGFILDPSLMTSVFLYCSFLTSESIKFKMDEKVTGIVMNTSFYLYTWELEPMEKYHKCKTFFFYKNKKLILTTKFHTLHITYFKTTC